MTIVVRILNLTLSAILGALLGVALGGHLHPLGAAVVAVIPPTVVGIVEAVIDYREKHAMRQGIDGLVRHTDDRATMARQARIRAIQGHSRDW